MVIKRFLCLGIILGMGIICMAQVQQGYVRTKGRMVSGKYYEGQRIPQATVQVKDQSAVLSKIDGSFSFPISGKSYSIKQVEKKGYVLLDQDVLYRQYTYSANPLELVMEDKAQLKADYRAIELKVRSTTYAELQRRSEELEMLKEQKRISDERYRELVQKLNNDQDNSEQRIKEMVDEYNKIDFDRLDEFNRRVSDCIINGRLDEADSLLRTKGSIKDGIEELNKHHEANVYFRADLEKSEAAEELRRQDLANRCYNRFLLCKMRYQNDSAAQYIEMRVELDTNNIEWLVGAGNFIELVQGDYEKALRYYQRALNVAQNENPESDWIPLLYNNIGANRSRMGNHREALEYYTKSLKIREKKLGKQHPDVAGCYNNLGFQYATLGDFSKAKQYYEKALAIDKKTLGENCIEMADLYNNMASLYDDMGKYEEALDLHQRSLDIRKKELGMDDPDVARSYNNIGIVLHNMGQYESAMENYRRALNINIKCLGENHPYIANIYHNIATIENVMGQYDSALYYHEKGLAIREKRLGKNHPDVAISYGNIGTTYEYKGNDSKALKNLKKALAILMAVWGDNHLDVASTCNNIGIIYAEHDNFKKAMEYLQKALTIRGSILGKNHPDVADTYSKIGAAYYYHKDYANAVEYYRQALAIQEKTLAPDHPDIARTYSSMGTVEGKAGNYQRALEHHRKSLEIWKKTAEQPDIASAYNNIGTTCFEMGDYEEALVNQLKSLEIKKKIFGEDNTSVAHAYNNLSHTYAGKKDYKNAGECLKKAIAIQENNQDRNGPNTETMRHNLSIVEQQRIETDASEMNEYVHTATVVEGKTPAKAQGMSGEYIVLEYCGWTIGSATSLFDKTVEMQGMPKTLVVMQNGTISRYEFENVIGVSFGLKKVGKEEKNRIKDQFNQWQSK